MLLQTTQKVYETLNQIQRKAGGQWDNMKADEDENTGKEPKTERETV